MPDRPIFFDTVTLSNFALVHQLPLLLDRFGTRGRVTDQVRDEITKGLIAGYTDLQDVETAIREKQLLTATMTDQERNVFQELLRTLASGEASCIACAEQRSGLVANDDRQARECCRARGIPFTGTVGILKACCEAGVIAPDAVDEILDNMTRIGFYAPVSRISDLL